MQEALRTKQAYLYAAATLFLWSTVASAFKLSLLHLNPIELLFYSSCVAVSFLLCTALWTGGFSDMRSWSPQDFARSAVLGFLNPFLYYLVLFEAYALLPAQEAQPLNFTWPLVLALFSVVLLKQPIGARSFACMLLSFTGILVIASRGNPLSLRLTHPLGVGLALGSSVVWALYWVQGLSDPKDAVPRLFLNFLFGCVFIALYGWTMESVRAPWVVGLSGLLGAAYVGLFEMGVTFILWTKALTLSPTTAHVSNLIFLSPFLSLIWIGTLVGEPIYPSTLLGLLLIVSGIVLLSYSQKHS